MGNLHTNAGHTKSAFHRIDWLVLKRNWDGFSEALSISGKFLIGPVHVIFLKWS